MFRKHHRFLSLRRKKYSENSDLDTKPNDIHLDLVSNSKSLPKGTKNQSISRRHSFSLKRRLSLRKLSKPATKYNYSSYEELRKPNYLTVSTSNNLINIGSGLRGAEGDTLRQLFREPLSSLDSLSLDYCQLWNSSKSNYLPIKVNYIGIDISLDSILNEARRQFEEQINSKKIEATRKKLDLKYIKELEKYHFLFRHPLDEKLKTEYLVTAQDVKDYYGTLWRIIDHPHRSHITTLLDFELAINERLFSFTFEEMVIYSYVRDVVAQLDEELEINLSIRHTQSSKAALKNDITT